MLFSTGRAVLTALLLLFSGILLAAAEPIPAPYQKPTTCTKWITKTTTTGTCKPHMVTTKTVSVTATRTISICPSMTTTCVPSAVQTRPVTYSLADFPTGLPDPGLGLTFGSDWGYIACKTFCSSSCGSGVPSCDPSCSTKGSCGNSLQTNFYLNGLAADLANPQYWIVPTAPAKTFTLFTLYLTSGDLYTSTKYTSITVKITGISRSGTALAPLYVILPKPTQPPLWFTEIKINLVDAGYGDVSRLDFLSYFTGTEGSGGWGPGGVAPAGLKIDGDGFGGPVRGEVYTPLGC